MSDENRAKKREALPRRVLLLLTSRSYRSIAFIEAAARLDIEVVKAVNMEEHLAEYWNFPLGLNYNDLKSATASIVNYAAEHPLGAVLAVDDSGTLWPLSGLRTIYIGDGGGSDDQLELPSCWNLQAHFLKQVTPI